MLAQTQGGLFRLLVTLGAMLAGGIASIAGFGIGSILTPLLAIQIGTKLAVAVVSIPHFIGTAVRFVLIREHVEKRVLLSFGIASAGAGLAGALLHPPFFNSLLGHIFGALFVFAGIMGIKGLFKQLRLESGAGWGFLWL